MPFGYNYLEIINAKEKGRFLRKHMNQTETKLFITLYILTQFVLLFFVISLFIGKDWIAVSFALLCFHSILTQNFRRVMCLKYNYNKRDSKLKTWLQNTLLIVGFLISIAFLFGFSVFGWLENLIF